MLKADAMDYVLTLSDVDRSRLVHCINKAGEGRDQEFVFDKFTMATDMICNAQRVNERYVLTVSPKYRDFMLNCIDITKNDWIRRWDASDADMFDELIHVLRTSPRVAGLSEKARNRIGIRIVHYEKER